MRWKPLFLLALLLAAPACAHKDRPGHHKAPATWRSMATNGDRERIRRWRAAWTEALPLAKTVDAQTIAADPLLFDPDRALPDGAMPPAGAYRCRVFKLGASPNGGLRDFTAFPPADCQVEDQGEVRGFAKTSGAQRPVGLLFSEAPARAMFLGTLVLGDETSPLQYSQDANRDMIGYVERIGPTRWRLVFPYPKFESLLDVVELTPAG